MEMIEIKINLLDFIVLNPWSSFFTLLFLGALVRRILSPNFVCRVKVFYGLMSVLVLGLVIFSPKMAEFVDKWPEVYCVILYLSYDFLDDLIFPKKKIKKKGKKDEQKKDEND